MRKLGLLPCLLLASPAAAVPPVPTPEVVRQTLRCGSAASDEEGRREAGQLRHAAYAFLADRPEARDRRRGALGRGGNEVVRPGDAPDLRHCDRPPGPDADQGLQRRRHSARHRAAERRGHHHRPYRQPGDRPDELHRRRARSQRRRIGHGRGHRGGAGAFEAQVSRDDRLCGALGGGAGAAWRQDPRRPCEGAGLERHRQPQQRHHREQLLVGRRLQRQGRAGFLRRAALAGA